MATTELTKLIPWLISLALAGACWFLWERNQTLVAEKATCAAELDRVTEDADAIRDRIILFTQQQAAVERDLQVARQRIREAQVPQECTAAVNWLAEEISNGPR